jgi:peptidoglycan L-alanyl-D-glutamate endopeptidase CwlK
LNTDIDKYDSRSWRNLADVHPDLVKVVQRAGELGREQGVHFMVTEGVRTKAKQAEYVKSGASQTMQGRHIYGFAVDLAAVVGKDVRWDWPLYRKLYTVMQQAANELNTPIIWGGNWREFKDGPHFELPRQTYPDPAA